MANHEYQGEDLGFKGPKKFALKHIKLWEKQMEEYLEDFKEGDELWFSFEIGKIGPPPPPPPPGP